MKEERYFYVPDAQTEQELPQEEAVHAVRVLRLKEGDTIFLQDGNGSFYRAEVTQAQGKHCYYSIIETIPQDKLWRGHLHLAMAPTKMMERVEWLVEKGTEIGCDEFSFMICRFSERMRLRTDRLEKIVVSAVKQSRKAWKPQVNEIEPLPSFLSRPRNGKKYICHCYDEIPRKDLYAELQALDKDEDITVLIGPEGDFSVEEVKSAMDNGYVSVTLGSARLRTETAALSAIMMMQLVRRKEQNL